MGPALQVPPGPVEDTARPGVSATGAGLAERERREGGWVASTVPSSPALLRGSSVCGPTEQGRPLDVHLLPAPVCIPR